MSSLADDEAAVRAALWAARGREANNNMNFKNDALSRNCEAAAAAAARGGMLVAPGGVARVPPRKQAPREGEDESFDSRVGDLARLKRRVRAEIWHEYGGEGEPAEAGILPGFDRRVDEAFDELRQRRSKEVEDRFERNVGAVMAQLVEESMAELKKQQQQQQPPAAHLKEEDDDWAHQGRTASTDVGPCAAHGGRRDEDFDLIFGASTARRLTPPMQQHDDRLARHGTGPAAMVADPYTNSARGGPYSEDRSPRVVDQHAHQNNTWSGRRTPETHTAPYGDYYKNDNKGRAALPTHAQPRGASRPPSNDSDLNRSGNRRFTAQRTASSIVFG